MSSLLDVVGQTGASLLGNPAILTRLMAFIVGILLALSNDSIRDRLRRILVLMWIKLKATAGMGVKVSYV